MKHLLACLAILAAFNVTAQVDGFQLPYNPDVEPDGYIGVADILELLVMFGSEFEVASLSSDSSSAIVLVDENINYWACGKACNQLGRGWSMLDKSDVQAHYDQIGISNNPIGLKEIWLDSDHLESIQVIVKHPNSSNFLNAGIINTSDNYGKITWGNMCYCTAKVRPEIEYQVVFGTNSNAIQANVQLALQEGWMVLGGASVSGTADSYQTMWRYAD